MNFRIEPIATIRTPFKEKFGTPRQPGLTPSAVATIEFQDGFANGEAIRGLEEFSHLLRAASSVVALVYPVFPGWAHVGASPNGIDRRFQLRLNQACRGIPATPDKKQNISHRGSAP